MADNTYSTVTPYLVVSDGDAELRFIQQAFGGIDQGTHRREDGTLMHAEVKVGNSLIMLGQASEQIEPRTAALYLWVDDVDATYAKALQTGAASESAPEDKDYGHRNAGVIDVNGITWWIGAPVKT